VLAQPANRHLITKIKTSITAGIRPTSMIFHEQPTAPWVPFDFILLEAYQRLQDELCPKCGHPVWFCRSQGNAVQFSVQTAYCASERALKEWEDRQNGKKAEKKDKAAWGRFTYTVPKPLPGQELPTRSEYYEDLAKLEGTVE
jgi:hypothetical protein